MEADRVPLSSSHIPLQRVVTPNSEQSIATISSDDDEKSEAAVMVESSPTLSVSTDTPLSDSGYHGAWDGYDSPLPQDVHIAARRDERRYRLLLQHDFHPTCELDFRSQE